jgi:signal peptidase I
MNPVFSVGETVVITDPVDDHYADMGGVIVEEIFRNYLSEYVYVVKVDDGYEVEFSADELTAVDDMD